MPKIRPPPSSTSVNVTREVGGGGIENKAVIDPISDKSKDYEETKNWTRFS